MTVTSAVWVLALDAALVLAFGLISTDQVFLSGASFQNIALGAAVPVILAVGFALLLGAGEFDLSLGANLVLSSVVGAKLMTALGGGLWGVVGGVTACVAVGCSRRRVQRRRRRPRSRELVDRHAGHHRGRDRTRVRGHGCR